MKTGRQVLLFSPLAHELRYPPDCPFKPERAAIARSRLLQFGWLNTDGLVELNVDPASDEQILRFHTPEYVAELKRAAAGELTLQGVQMGLGTPDTPVFKHMFLYSALACGASITGARLIAEGRAQVVFNLFGGLHHARPARAAGFCFLNDAVLACMELCAQKLKVLYLDVDAHHGDGVQEAFYTSPEVLTVSVHETGRTLFPGTGFEDEIGAGPGTGYCLNIPLPPGTYDAAFLHAFHTIVEPVVRAFAPDVVVAELGMDALAGDPLTHLALTNNAYVKVVEFLKGLGKPVLVLGGGGYNVQNTVRGWILCWKVFAELDDGMDWDTGVGGVFLGSSEWVGGLTDPELPVSAEQRRRVEEALSATLTRLQEKIFPLWGLPLRMNL